MYVCVCVCVSVCVCVCVCVCVQVCTVAISADYMRRRLVNSLEQTSLGSFIETKGLEGPAKVCVSWDQLHRPVASWLIASE